MQPSIQVLNHKRSFQSRPKSLCFFVRLEIRGGSENLSPAGDRFFGLRRSFEEAKASRPPVRGRLAGGASV